MENVLYNIGQVLGITIIHSLWQGLFIYFMLKVALFIGGKMPASKKYMLALTSMAAIAGWFFYTLVTEIQTYSWLAQIPDNLSAMPLFMELPKGMRAVSDPGLRYYYSIEKYLPFITVLYIVGLVFNISRILFANNKIRQIKQTMSIDINLQRQVNKFAEMLGIEHRVKIGLSELVNVPCMMGYAKPIILLPFTLTTYLGAEEIEAILLHELAHIKRNDYLVNLLQQVISALLFFNPCAQLINKIINEERENCCDDLVVQSAPDPVVYAKALLKLEQVRENNMRMAMAATGKKYQLLSRIERIMKTKNQPQSLRPALLAMLILAAGIGFITLLNPEIAQGKISIKSISPVIKELLADTSRKDTSKKALKKKIKAEKTASEHMETLVDMDDDFATEHDKKLDELNAEIQKHADKLNDYYNGDNLKALQENISEQGKLLQDAYNSAGIKKFDEEMAKMGADYSKNWGANGKLLGLSEKMGKSGAEMGEYFSSPDFKKMNKELRKKYGLGEHDMYLEDSDDPNYKRYHEELMSKIPTHIKEIEKQLNDMGAQISLNYQSPAFKKQEERMRLMGDSLAIAFNNPAFEQQKLKMEELTRKLGDFKNNPGLKEEAEELKKSVEKLTNYINSPEYKKYLKSIRKNYNHNFNYNFNYNDDYDKPEKPERPEAPEKPEKVEKPEKPDAPEAPDAPEN